MAKRTSERTRPGLPLMALLRERASKPTKGNGPRAANEVAMLIMFRRHVCEDKKVAKALEDADWFDLSIGYFMGMRCTYEQAHRLALYARYDCHYWQEERTLETLKGVKA